MPDPVSCEVILLIGMIFHEYDFMFLRVIEDFAAGDLQQRPQDHTSLGRNPAKTVKSASAAQVQDLCLQLVIRIVCRGDPVTLQFFSGLFQKGISHLPGRFFHAQMVLLRLLADFPESDLQRDISFLTPVPHKSAVPGGFQSSQLMIEMSRAHPDPPFLPVVPQAVQKHHGMLLPEGILFRISST